MRYLSLFSGVEAASVAWHPLGWECVAVSEIEPFPCAVLAHHYPTVPNLGDVTKVTEADIAALGPIDLVVFGSPCQDLSVAGKRRGLAGERSGLFHTAMDIIGWARKHCGCRWALWENVPGAFSSNQGRDFAAVVEQMAGVAVDVPRSGWGTEGVALGEEGLVEWAVLDAQWFGVAQRRRRVFALADFGDWFNRPPVLLESYRLRGDTPPRREAGQETAGGVGAGVDLRNGSITGDVTMTVQAGAHAPDPGSTPHLLQPVAIQDVTGREKAQNGKGWNDDGTSYTLDTAATQGVALAVHGTQDPDLRFDQAHTLGRNSGQENAVLAEYYSHDYCHDRIYSVEGISPALNCSQIHSFRTAMAVRRLTPTECERLQGFPDGWTLIPLQRKKPTDVLKFSADGPRYKALGNSMAVPVMRWIGEQIAIAELC